MTELGLAKMWQKIATGVITGAILMVLANVGQIFYTQSIVDQHTQQINELKEKDNELLRTKSFLRYVELAEERNKYLKEGIDKNSENLKILQNKIDRELSKIREAIGFRYRGETMRK